MKFGKELLRAVSASTTVMSADNWLDYKGLKKQLKKMPKEEESAGEQERGGLQHQKIVQSTAEREFFKALLAELNKVEARFNELWEKVLVATKEWEAETTDPKDTEQLAGLLQRCTNDHMFVLLVENYAVLNYCGFTKILKKHDKLRSTLTRDKYMNRMVNEKSFSKFDRMHEVLLTIEKRFHHLCFLIKKSQGETENAKEHASPQSSASSLASSSSSLSKSSAAVFVEKASVENNRKEAKRSEGMERLKSLAQTVAMLHSGEEIGSVSNSLSHSLKRAVTAAAAAAAAEGLITEGLVQRKKTKSPSSAGAR